MKKWFKENKGEIIIIIVGTIMCIVSGYMNYLEHKDDPKFWVQVGNDKPFSMTVDKDIKYKHRYILIYTAYKGCMLTTHLRNGETVKIWPCNKSQQQ